MSYSQGMELLQKQKLALKLSPQLLQSVKLMELPLAELREKISEEIEKNPALEIVKDRTVVSLSDLELPAQSEEKVYFETSSDAGFAVKGGSGDYADKYRRFIENAFTRPETLQEHLLFQLRLQPVPEDICALGEIFIQNLSSDGFHKEDIGLLACGASPRNREDALELVRRLDPQGCCTADYKEALAVQARLHFGAEAEEIIALIPCMESLEKGKTALAQRLLKKNAEEVRELFEKLRTLSPFPGRQFLSSAAISVTRFIIPEVRVIHAAGELKIIINNETIPVLGIAPFFDGQNEKIHDPQEQDFIRSNLRDARWFIHALNRRNQTVFRVCKAIVHFQRKFFELGPQHLVPLSQRDIAKRIKVHETTVSRAANGKYMETEWGIFEIRHFFTNSISGAGSKGSRFSHEAVKEIIREIIQSEIAPQTDGDIVKALALRGITLARRTVAKYRSQLDLGSSYQR